MKFRIAIVPGRTPFLISSTFLKGIGAVIDTDKGTLWSKTLNKELIIEPNQKNLYTMDINQLWENPSSVQQIQESDASGLTCATETSQRMLPGSESPHHETLNVEGQRSHEVHDMPHDMNMRQKPISLLQQDQGPDQPKSAVSFASAQDSHPVVHRRAHEFQDEQHPTATEGLPRVSAEAHRSVRTDQDSEDELGRAGSREDCLWKGKDGSVVRESLSGCLLDGLVRSDVREESETSSPTLHQVCREASECRDHGGHPEEQSQCQGSQTDSQSRSGIRNDCSRGDVMGRDLRAGPDPRVRSARDQQAEPSRRSSEQPPSPEPEPGPPHDPDGDDNAGTFATHSRTECEDRALGSNPMPDEALTSCLDMDFEFSKPNQNFHYQAKIQKLVKKFTQELNQVIHQREASRMPAGTRLDLLEVMCSPNSELTNQVRKLGGRAERFGRVQGDLQTSDGRKRLFSLLLHGRPKHLWYSPECKPWCQWSAFNMNRSIQGHENILNQRTDSLWQVALGIVLFRYQTLHKGHLDLEQPRGSAYWKIPSMHEVLQQTYWNEFDMCRLGDLRDPQTGEAIRKRLTVISTSEDLHVALHGKLCQGQHHHRPIAGSIRVSNEVIKTSKWTELYPQKFARQVGKIILHDSSLQVPVMVGEDDHPTKRRRLGSKLSPMAIEARFGSDASDINWQTVMRLADQTAPRVGTHVGDQGEIIQQIQHLCPEYLIKHLVLCRGTDRYVGPNRPMLPQTAPLRRQICIRRQTQDIHVDPWEAWEALSKRNLRKKGVPARVSLTVFAAARQPESPDNRLPQMLPSADVTNTGAQRRSHEMLVTPGDDDHRAKRSRGNESENMSNPTATHAPQSTPITDHQTESTSETQIEETPQHIIDLASQKHGPMFNCLKAEEQNWLLKLHRNLGHPGATKLTEFCRQLQCPEHLLKAIQDLRCSTCQETRGPVVSRPSAIHETCDFGDVVSMDGITWTNQNGDQFHFYHFIDQSTLFHTAVATPGRSTDDACKALLTGWFNWAGPPGLLCVDSGTELNSDEFSSFLQRHSVKCRTCAAEAHWQNARTERHGGILQLMLKKMDHEQPIRTYEQLAVALSHATSTKNQWSKYKGYPPEMLVFGKGVRVPGSITSDPTVSAHSIALSNMPEGIRFRQDLATREAARKAFSEVDNDQTLRRALVQRSRPHRGFYDKGDWVMMWKKKGEADGNWLGYMQVIIQEGQNVIWVTRHHKLYRVPPVYIRSLSAFEEFKHQPHVTQTEGASMSIQPAHGGVQFHDMISQDSHQIPAVAPASPANQMPGPTRGHSDEVPTGDANQQDQNSQNVQPQSPQHEQPDQEPDIPSISSSTPSHQSENPEPIATPAHEIPIPDTSDEGESLYTHEESCFHLQEDHMYRFEINIMQK